MNDELIHYLFTRGSQNFWIAIDWAANPRRGTWQDLANVPRHQQWRLSK
jgi:hypothetical protein